MTASESELLQIGVAARIHSIEFAIQNLQALLVEHRGMLARLQGDGAQPKRLGRPPGSGKTAASTAKLHPRDPAHPEHAAWAAAHAARMRKQWARMSKADKQSRIEKMLATRRARAAA